MNRYLNTPVFKHQQDFDDVILSLMAKGLNQAEISIELKKIGHKPNSLSSIEKAIKRIREQHNANTNFHLACILIKKGYQFK